jgi:hypothetical protein
VIEQMRKYGIKLLLFLLAFAVGTVAAVLFWQEEKSQSGIQSTVPTLQDSETVHPKTDGKSNLPPTLIFDSEARGCGDFRVYKSTADKSKVIALKVKRDELKLGFGTKIFQIENDKSIELILYDFGEGSYENYGELCYDLVTDSKPTKTIASSGIVTVTVSKPLQNGRYSVSVFLHEASFRLQDEGSLTLKNIEIKDATVGWYPG